MLALFIGLAAGAVHVLMGPDHLAAVAPFSTENTKRTWVTGFLWGVGHTSGVWTIGLLALIVQGPWEQLSTWGDGLASIGLIGVGLWRLYKVVDQRIGGRRRDLDAQLRRYLHQRRGGRNYSRSRVACAFGVLHGLGGSSHYLGVLPALALPSGAEGALYLVGFGSATIATMVVFSWGVGKVALCAGARLCDALRTSCAIGAIGIGGIWFIN